MKKCRFVNILAWLALAGMCLFPISSIADDDCDEDESRDLDEMEEWYEGDGSSLIIDVGDEEDGCSTTDAVAEFKTVEEIYEKLESWSTNDCFDKLIEFSWLTTLVDGKDVAVKTAEYSQKIPYIRVGRNLGAHGKPAILIVSGAHAREYIGPLVTMYFVNRLIYELYHDDMPRVLGLLKQVELIVVPLLNPDGTRFVNDGAELDWWWPNLPTQTSCEPSHIWRKNRNFDADPGVWGPIENEAKYMLSSCIGVDLNRNWDWNRPADPTTVVESICRDSFPGAEPESGFPGTQHHLFFISKHFQRLHKGEQVPCLRK